MSDECKGVVYNPRVGQRQGSAGVAQGVNGEIIDQSEEHPESKDGGKENRSSDESSRELIAAAKLIERASEEDLIKAGIISESETEMMSVAFSGMLPHPSIYKMYDAETRERMCQWNDAYTIDESKRQNKLIDLEIKIRARAQWMSMCLMAFAFICAVVTYALYHDAIFSVAFIAVPFITVLANGIQAVKPKTRTNDNQSGKK